jgi:hypothetical protein
MTDSDVETGSAAYIGNRLLRIDQELATATRGRVLLVNYKYFNILYIINKIISNCIVKARTPALSFFQNPALDRESNLHSILTRI